MMEWYQHENNHNNRGEEHEALEPANGRAKEAILYRMEIANRPPWDVVGSSQPAFDRKDPLHANL